MDEYEDEKDKIEAEYRQYKKSREAFLMRSVWICCQYHMFKRTFPRIVTLHHVWELEEI